MAIAPSILLHSYPRGRLQFAFQSVVPGLVEAALLFAEQLREVVGRGGEGGRLLPAPRLRRQPVLEKSVQDREVPRSVQIFDPFEPQQDRDSARRRRWRVRTDYWRATLTQC